MALKVWHCKRCEHEWAGRKDTAKPKFCPRCKSPYWDRKRMREAHA